MLSAMVNESVPEPSTRSVRPPDSITTTPGRLAAPKLGSPMWFKGCPPKPPGSVLELCSAQFGALPASVSPAIHEAAAQFVLLLARATYCAVKPTGTMVPVSAVAPLPGRMSRRKLIFP